MNGGAGSNSFDLGPMPPTPDVGPSAPNAGTLEPIAPNVWAWIGNDTPNVGVVVEDDGITLIDTSFAPSVARALNEALKRFQVPVRRLVYTSSHVDSVGGSPVFWMAARYGRSQTNALLDQPVPVEAYRRLVPAFAQEFDAGFSTRPVSHVVDAAAWLTPLVCAVPVSGHQDENLVVLVPSAGTLFAGALGSGNSTPNAWDGDPAVWADTLGELADQLVSQSTNGVVVGGTGPISSPGHLRVQQAYLYACVDAEGDARRIPAGPWDEWSLREFDEVNVERAKRLSVDDRDVPTAMLRLLGLA